MLFALIDNLLDISLIFIVAIVFKKYYSVFLGFF